MFFDSLDLTIETFRPLPAKKFAIIFSSPIVAESPILWNSFSAMFWRRSKANAS
jgi:hypothetical protein